MAERSLEELVEEAVERLTSEQLHALASRKAAAEVRRREPKRPAPTFDLEAAVTFDLEAAIGFLLNRYVGAVGLDADLVAPWLLPQLVRVGASETDALAALEKTTAWKPRTDEERWQAVAAEMIRGGWPAAQVRWAIAAVRSRDMEVAA